jgi:DNA polymerase-3 subunit epsilon
MKRLKTVSDVENIEHLAREVEQHPDYKVLRRLQPKRRFGVWDGQEEVVQVALVDTETTGMNADRDEIIELGLVVVAVGATSGQAFEVLESYGGLEEPSGPIPPETTRVHGITDAMVAGQRIDDLRVEAMLKDVGLVIAHNAGFDRRFLEKRLPVFARLPWACSVKDVAWHEEGFRSQKLDYILMQCGYFHEAHRAEADCLALLDVLQRPLEKAGGVAMTQLFRAANQKRYRIWAVNSPFDAKDALKAVGYRWEAAVRCWNLETSEVALDEELRRLKQLAFPNREATITLETLDARVRFSDRPGFREVRFI